MSTYSLLIYIAWLLPLCLGSARAIHCIVTNLMYSCSEGDDNDSDDDGDDDNERDVMVIIIVVVMVNERDDDVDDRT